MLFPAFSSAGKEISVNGEEMRFFEGLFPDNQVLLLFLVSREALFEGVLFSIPNHSLTENLYRKDTVVPSFRILAQVPFILLISSSTIPPRSTTSASRPLMLSSSYSKLANIPRATVSSLYTQLHPI